MSAKEALCQFDVCCVFFFFISGLFLMSVCCERQFVVKDRNWPDFV